MTLCSSVGGGPGGGLIPCKGLGRYEEGQLVLVKRNEVNYVHICHLMNLTQTFYVLFFSSFTGSHLC